MWPLKTATSVPPDHKVGLWMWRGGQYRQTDIQTQGEREREREREREKERERSLLLASCATFYEDLTISWSVHDPRDSG